jgi:hypothetical protein
MDAGLKVSHLFDFMIEPGEYAADDDRGATVTDRDRTHVIAPIRLVQSMDLIDRGEARRDLGLDPDRLAVLVQLGRGVIGDFDAFAAMVASALPSDAQIVLAARQSSIHVPEAISVDTYPLAASFSAFDCAISASGYNTFHESLSLGLPSLFVPNTQTRTKRLGRAGPSVLAWRWLPCHRTRTSNAISSTCSHRASSAPPFELRWARYLRPPAQKKQPP